MNKIAVMSILIITILFCIGLMCNLAFKGQNDGLYNLDYKFSSDYDLFLRIIKKFKMNGMSTKKNEIFGRFRRGGLSSRIKFIDYLKECNKIRLQNGQNFLLVYFIYILRLLKNINKFI